MVLIDGKICATRWKSEISQAVSLLQSESKITPHLAAILVGNDPASEAYVAGKVKDCEEVGFHSTLIRFEATVSQTVLLQKIEEINQNPSIHGLIVQLPLPKHIDANLVTETIAPEKDVDGFHPVQVGRMTKNLPAYISATPLGVLKMLEYYEIETAGKHCVVIGRSQIVGMPMSILMLRNAPQGNCTVTTCHSRTPDLAYFTRQADILIAAIGIPHFVKADMVKPQAVVIDVGINRIEDKSKTSGFRLVGDVDFETVAPISSHITPVPGGVGLMTRAALLYNTLLAAKLSFHQ
ncbi:MAG: bifunctional 5,10-methylenetetrahydrofolate dehydrogenase/5,10-methenyltetrahydrofolate cyclohydrolase [Cytophagales bacterium]|nr:MAG: bifunctional 5,10-methylenetetrahydrofolate dehydrogenase/5,10-methenyltetrahydrofolate cyclohydrolase [Cytophagales bacterium]